MRIFPVSRATLLGDRHRPRLPRLHRVRLLGSPAKSVNWRFDETTVDDAGDNVRSGAVCARRLLAASLEMTERHRTDAPTPARGAAKSSWPAATRQLSGGLAGTLPGAPLRTGSGEKVNITGQGEADCWLWTGAKDRRDTAVSTTTGGRRCRTDGCGSGKMAPWRPALACSTTPTCAAARRACCFSHVREGDARQTRPTWSSSDARRGSDQEYARGGRQGSDNPAALLHERDVEIIRYLYWERGIPPQRDRPLRDPSRASASITSSTA